MRGYQIKDEAALVYDANKRYIRAVAQTHLQRILNDVLSEMTVQFNQALTAGEIKEISSLESVDELVNAALQRRLEAGGAS